MLVTDGHGYYLTRIQDSISRSSGLAWLAAGDQAELEAADREAHVERLLEVRIALEHTAIPLLALSKVGRGIDRGS